MPIILWITLLLLSYYDAVKEVTGIPLNSNETCNLIPGDIASATATAKTVPTEVVETEVTTGKSCKTRTARPTVKLENCVEIEDRIISLLLSQILLIKNEVYCAPKLGGIMFEQLLLDTFIDDENNTNAHYNEKRAFTVPAPRTNIKNTTSLYAKLTGNSIRNSIVSASEHAYEEAIDHENTTDSPHTLANALENKSTGLRKAVPTDTITSSTSKLISAELPTTTVRTKVGYNISDSKKPSNNKSIKTEQKRNTCVHKLTPKENLIRNARSRIQKNRRDGAILQSNGYTFNGDICQMRGDRVLCGYSNQEPPLPGFEPEPANDDCLIRGERIECGYAKPIADSNRRSNKQKSSKQASSENDASKVAINLTTVVTITSDSPYSTTVTKFPAPTISTTNTPSPANIKNDLLKFETQKSIDHIEKMISSIITNSNISTHSLTTATTETDKTPTTTNITSPASAIGKESKISVSKIMELINRVEKIIASPATNFTTPSTLPISAIEIKLSQALQMLGRVEKKLQSLADTHVTTHTTATSISTTSSTPISSTTIFASPSTSTTTITNTPTTSTTTIPTTSTTTITTTPESYIAEGEVCVEKDGRIVCYDRTQEDYEEDYLEK